MRHRARRPFTDLWLRIPRATARLIHGGARPRPARALAAVTAVLLLGAAGVGVASMIGGPADPQAGSIGVDPTLGTTESADDARPSATPKRPTRDGRTPSGSSSEPETPAAEQSETPSTPAPTTDSPTTEPTTPSPSPSRSSPTADSARLDRTPPRTSLSSEFPAQDAALLSFSANESATFTCSLDEADYTPCDSSMTYSDLHPGWHTFAVRATDAAGNVDPSPAEVRWLALVDGAIGH